MDTLTVLAENPAATEGIGAALGGLLRPGDLVRLRGELGAGKTTFARGVGRGLGLAEPLSSPTYLLCKEYEAPSGPVLHLDGYFAERLDSLLGEGLVERLDERSVVLVEWPERIGGWLPEQGLCLDIAPVPEPAAAQEPGGASIIDGGGDDPEDAAPRLLRFRAHGRRAAARLGELARILVESGISVEPGRAEGR